jgi:integrase
MPRHPKGPRLLLRRRKTRPRVWVILDDGQEVSTGCSASDTEHAQAALARYIAARHEPRTDTNRLEDLAIADVLNIYLREHAPATRSLDFILHTAKPIIEWWGEQSLSDIRGKTYRAYVSWRVKQGVSDQTARHDLKTLRAAIGYHHREYGPLASVPAVTMPDPAPPRDRWLTRREAAAMIRIARRNPQTQHVARFILIGIYTGTRSQAILALRWTPSSAHGWFDLDAERLYRRGTQQTESKKRQPVARIHQRLLPHLRRWHRQDRALGIGAVVHYQGQAVRKLRRSWKTLRTAAGLGTDVVPHTTRHTCATWLMQSGVPIFEAAGYLGMSVATLQNVYGHHHPDFQSRAAGLKEPAIIRSPCRVGP